MLNFYVCVAILGFITWRIVKLTAAYLRIGHIPGFFTLFEPTTAIGGSIPSNSWNLGLSFTWLRKDYLYKQYQSELITIFPVLWGDCNVYNSSPEAARQILSTNAPWHRPEKAMKAIDIMGPNVFASEFDYWKKQRRIASPAFNASSYRMVWDETARTYHQMMSRPEWKSKAVVSVDNFNVYTRKLALFIIAAVGFGLPLEWDEPRYNSRGDMSAEEVITQVSTNILPRYAVPWWVYYVFPTKKLKLIDSAFKSMELLLRNLIKKRNTEMKKRIELNEDMDESIKDVFGRLVLSQVQNGAKLSLNDREIIGNSFIFLFAGHETTAHTLSATLAMLALHEDEQEHVYQHIKKVLPDDRAPTFADYDALDTVLATFYEALRLYPPAYMLTRDNHEDTIIATPSIKTPGETAKIPLKKGTTVMSDMVGLCYNERLYPDAKTFKPSRWYGNVDRVFAFGYGPRICLGMKFATTEATAFLTLLLRDWKVELNMLDGETKERWKTRILKPELVITLTFDQVPLKFIRRQASE
ncbi:cytochrome P450 [Sistotremastrum niveocremeum HHB9708]|uniref:Cytochrome P450 n=1 Tax=Sistotremastrum niveocremeum HHB9708 TaxID=1314777 RepID=A0A164SZX4_9AGAM|nr:cytochrome P450 [Sistotremastrum niveocremeum HHB9708]